MEGRGRGKKSQVDSILPQVGPPVGSWVGWSPGGVGWSPGRVGQGHGGQVGAGVGQGVGGVGGQRGSGRGTGPHKGWGGIGWRSISPSRRSQPEPDV